ncbi:MAG TPA: cation:proton antiporter [Ilumatobacteraceae bacterium]|nr:cation:proton antiporter [Ilumatobacteraceae bacterium]
METEALRALVLIIGIAVLSPFISDVVKRWTRLPAVVVEIGLGILIGPYVLGLVELDDVISFLAELGLVFLIFLAGFEVDPNRVKGRPVKLAVGGWMISLVVAIAAATLLYALDVTSAIRFVAICLTTTAIGTLLPILGDAGVLPTRLGTNILASGAVGEIGPIVAISLALTTDNPGRTTAILVAFASIAALVGWLATRPARPRTIMLIERTLHSSGQLGVRISILLCLLLVWTADEFGLDILLGAFVAGMVARLFLVGHTGQVAADESMHDFRIEVQHGIEALGFGFFIPLFFVVSGVRFDLDALLDPIELLKVPMFLGLMLLARGLPALLYRRDLTRHDVAALALLQSAGLPLIVVITSIGVSTGQMRPDNAAGLVGAGLLSVVIFPIIALSIHAKGVSATELTGVPPSSERGALGN